MRLELENIGKIKKADIILNGITVIAGENSTGKSTVGKALFSVFNSFYNLDKQIEDTRREMIENIISDTMRNEGYFVTDIDDFIDEIIKKKLIINENYDGLISELNRHIVSMGGDTEIPLYRRESVNEIIKRVKEILSVVNKEIFNKILQKRINGEFKKQITTIGEFKEEGRICLNVRENDIEIKLIDQEIKSISNAISMKTQAVYVDNPLIMDSLANYSTDFLDRIKKQKKYISHRRHLELCLIEDENKGDVEQAIDELIVDKQLENIEIRLNEICAGTFRNNKYYQIKDDGPMLDVRNVSAGIKIFMVIKQLLKNRKLEEKGILILDEPEVYLHPKWQLAFAELIIMLQKQYNMHILLATHSPYFLRAIEVYAGKYGIANKCDFYIAESEGLLANIRNVTNNTEEIYKKMLEPFEALQLETYSE